MEGGLPLHLTHTMKHLALGVATLSVMASAALAGNTMTRDKAVAPPAPIRVFGPNETQFDMFGTYLVGKGPDHTGPLRDHGWGGGVGINQFFNEYFGLGIDVAAIYGREYPQRSSSHTTLTQGTGSLILRVPYEEYSMAPYAFIGGGVTGGAGNWASAHGGLGLEYRLVPNSVGLFTDVRWTYYGDAHSNGDLNNFQARAGIRFVF